MYGNAYLTHAPGQVVLPMVEPEVACVCLCLLEMLVSTVFSAAIIQLFSIPKVEFERLYYRIILLRVWQCPVDYCSGPGRSSMVEPEILYREA
jgi:hypothetical protein